MTEQRHQSAVDRFGKYVEIKPVVMLGEPDAHHVSLVSTNQSFCVSPDGCKTLERAEWMRDMLCVALSKIVDDERHL